jgi:two-component system phosphate regulon sensor histidine kinase PhoR
MMKFAGKMRLAALLMVLTIIGVAVFQGYWIRKLYTEEWNGLRRETDVAFRDAMYELQVQRFHKGKLLVKDTHFAARAADNLFMLNVLDSMKTLIGDSVRAVAKDSTKSRLPRQVAISFQTDIRHDSLSPDLPDRVVRLAGDDNSLIVRYLSNSDSGAPALTMGEMDSAYKRALVKSGITVAYTLQRFAGNDTALLKPVPKNELKTGIVFIGLSNAYGYRASFSNPFGYIIGKLRLPIGMSVLLLAFTALSLLFLYRNLLKQRQIAEIKNEFISNMTHELKTPISTVTVAVEALRHFGALDDPHKTKEYLDISALELQRLSLLVDKVLKLSLFENRQIELKPERIDLPGLTAEVMASMRLPMEKAGAVVRLNCEGEGLFVRADRVHLGSVISNLLDNALKYSRENPVLAISVSREGAAVALSVADNGIGIPPAYREKIFEKFFRVPSNDVHTIKGYGLGLSYVHHIVARHEGRITVESKEGKGSTFIIQLPAA